MVGTLFRRVLAGLFNALDEDVMVAMLTGLDSWVKESGLNLESGREVWSSGLRDWFQGLQESSQ